MIFHAYDGAIPVVGTGKSRVKPKVIKHAMASLLRFVPKWSG
jgi:hypothetical protein